MKVEFKPTIANPQKTFFTKLRKFLSGKIKPAIKDSFEKTTSKSENTAKEVIISRENPNWCDGPEYRYRNNTIAQRICYYPEDLTPGTYSKTLAIGDKTIYVTFKVVQPPTNEGSTTVVF